jgi:hypothetical protein
VKLTPWRVAGRLFALLAIGVAIFVIVTPNRPQDMREAVLAQDVARVAELLRKDGTLAMTKVYPQGSQPKYGAREWRGRYVIHDLVGAFDAPRELLDLLRAHGADPGVRREGRTLLHDAALSGNLTAMRWLIEQGADVDAPVECDGCEEKGHTPLHEAQRRVREAVELLLAHGASVDATDARGRSALHAAAAERFTEAAWLLCSHGADPARKDRQGRTPHDVALAAPPGTRTELLGAGETAAWLRPGGGCERLASRARAGRPVALEAAEAAYREFACERGHADSCGTQGGPRERRP